MPPVLGPLVLVSDLVNSLGRSVCTRLKKMKSLAPHPWAVGDGR